MPNKPDWGFFEAIKGAGTVQARSCKKERGQEGASSGASKPQRRGSGSPVLKRELTPRVILISGENPLELRGTNKKPREKRTRRSSGVFKTSEGPISVLVVRRREGIKRSFAKENGGEGKRATTEKKQESQGNGRTSPCGHKGYVIRLSERASNPVTSLCIRHGKKRKKPSVINTTIGTRSTDCKRRKNVHIPAGDGATSKRRMSSSEKTGREK